MKRHESRGWEAGLAVGRGAGSRRAERSSVVSFFSFFFFESESLGVVIFSLNLFGLWTLFIFLCLYAGYSFLMYFSRTGKETN